MKKQFKLFISSILILPLVVFNNKTSIQTEISPHANYLETNIPRFYKENIYMNLLDTDFLGEEIIDLTALTGINSIKKFKEVYTYIELPNFESSISLFYSTKSLKGISFSTSILKKNWTSEKIKIIEGYETSGSASIYGKFSYTIGIEKNQELNHLLLKFKFYGNGEIETTASSPIGTIDTRWTFKLTGKTNT